MQKLQFNKTVISNLPFGNKTTRYVDQEVHWLQLWIGKKSKTYYACRWFETSPLRVKIGDATLINPVLARKKALEICTKLAQGEDPRVKRLSQVTLQHVWGDYQRLRTLRPGTLRTYQLALDNHYQHLLGKDILKITEEDISAVHLKLGRAGQEEYANGASRVIRCLLNFAMGQYRANGKSLLMQNPVQYLTRMKLWYRPRRRKGRLAASQVQLWLQQVGKLENQVMADCLILILLTGLRLKEALTIRWENVDLENRLFVIPGDTAKNHDDHTLPMTATIRSLFERRFQNRKPDNEFVFPGHITDMPLKSVTFGRQEIKSKIGIDIRAHDLRRTFITAAESLDISTYTLKRLLNHRNPDDVTIGYIIWNPIRLLRPLEQIEAQLLHGEANSW